MESVFSDFIIVRGAALYDLKPPARQFRISLLVYHDSCKKKLFSSKNSPKFSRGFSRQYFASFAACTSFSIHKNSTKLCQNFFLELRFAFCSVN